MYQQERQKVTAQGAKTQMPSKQNNGKVLYTYHQDSRNTVSTINSVTSLSSSKQNDENSIHGPKRRVPMPRSKSVGIIEGVGMFKQPSNDAAMSPLGKPKVLIGGRKTESRPASPLKKPWLTSEEDSTQDLNGDARSSTPSDRGSWVGTFRFGITDRTFKGIDDSSP